MSQSPKKQEHGSKKKGYSAYILTPTSRKDLLKRYPPRFNKVIAHHATYRFPDTNPPPPCSLIQVIGYASTSQNDPFDHLRVDCVIVRVLDTEIRPDEQLFHITLSLDPKTTRPVHSNYLLKQKGWTPIEHPFWLEVSPSLIPF